MRRLSSYPPRQEREYADDHGECVVIDISRLNLAQQRRCRTDQACAAVDEKAVDDRSVADVGEQRADASKPAGEEPIVEAVDVVIVHQQGVERAGPGLYFRRQFGTLDVQEPRVAITAKSRPKRKARPPALIKRT